MYVTGLQFVKGRAIVSVIVAGDSMRVQRCCGKGEWRGTFEQSSRQTGWVGYTIDKKSHHARVGAGTLETRCAFCWLGRPSSE